MIFNTEEYLPFEFEDKEDRDLVRNEWFYDGSCDWVDEVKPLSFHRNALGKWFVAIIRNWSSSDNSPEIEWYTNEQFLNKFCFVKNGKPAGKCLE